jgi:hypothetical protein
MHEIIAVGGTGQMVLHLYATWYLSGFVVKPFRALVVDTDPLTPSLDCLRRFFADVRAAAGSEQSGNLPEIEYFYAGSDQGGTVEQNLAGRRLEGSAAFEHSVQAFFAESDRKQSVKEGLFARPALAAVLTTDPLFEKLRYLPPRSTVGLVCSVIGGTGAGLALPILSYLQNQMEARHSLRAVFLRRFFQPDPGTRGDQLEIFQSNEALFEESLRQLLRPLDHFTWIQPGEIITRNKEIEKGMRHWPWPEKEDHPYWRAASALKQMLEDTHSDIGTMMPYEYRPETRAQAADRLEDALSRVEAACRHQPFLQMARDIFVPQVWGPMMQYVNSYADFLGIERTRFAQQVQQELGRRWRPTTHADYALRLVFPEPRRREEPPPSELIRCGWQERPDSASREFLGGQGDAVRRVAARALFTLLRSGGAMQ